jgi:hypothetical protein
MITCINEKVDKIEIAYRNISEYDKTVKIICYINKLIRQTPSNKNVIISGIDAKVAKVYTENGWEEKPIYYILDDIIKFRARQVLNLNLPLDIKFLDLIIENGFSCLPLGYGTDYDLFEYPPILFIQSFLD